MILSNRELHRALDEGRLIIEPQPTPRVPLAAGGHCPFDTHSVDLRLADEVVVPQDDGVAAIDFSRAGPVAQFIHRNSKAHKITREQPFKLAPQQFVLARTIERVGLPIPAIGAPALRRASKARAAERDSAS